MTGRERVKHAMHYEKPDRVPVQYYYTPVGYYEHGDRLNDLYSTLPGDFEPFRRMTVCSPAAEDYDAEGIYHAYRHDDWGTIWEYRIFGITGIPVKFPLEDISTLDCYVLPQPPSISGPEFDKYCEMVAAHQKQYYFQQHAGSLYERLISLRREEDVLCDIALDEPEINLLADRIVEHSAAHVQMAVTAKADGIAFGDDYGMEKGLIMSPALWRSFIKPRLKCLFAPAVKAGLNINFHSCGYIADILEDLKEVGVTSIWPQLPIYDMQWLAQRCRSLGLSVAIHTDRARTMTFGTPQQVKDLVLREYETFRMADGGSWFYVEADNGFPYENIEALVNTIKELD